MKGDSERKYSEGILRRAFPAVRGFLYGKGSIPLDIYGLGKSIPVFAGIGASRSASWQAGDTSLKIISKCQRYNSKNILINRYGDL